MQAWEAKLGCPVPSSRTIRRTRRCLDQPTHEARPQSLPPKQLTHPAMGAIEFGSSIDGLNHSLSCCRPNYLGLREQPWVASHQIIVLHPIETSPAESSARAVHHFAPCPASILRGRMVALPRLRLLRQIGVFLGYIEQLFPDRGIGHSASESPGFPLPLSIISATERRSWLRAGHCSLTT
jgi:hypothetical protein